MTKHIRIATCILLLVIAGALILALTGGNREPVYQGKPLSLWLEDCYRTPDARKQATEAVRQIGTNSIPTLLRMIRAKDPSPLKRKLLDLAGKQSLIRIRYPDARGRHDGAYFAFQILSTNAVCAVPELIRICEEPRYPASQNYAATALGSIGPAAKAAIPVLLRNFNHTNAEVRRAAVTAAYVIGGEANMVVPAFKRMLKDSDRDVRWSAANALQSCGAPARSAIPELLEALQDRDPGVKEVVENALWNVAPERIAKPLVVEDSTPMVANGVTTEALSRESSGTLWTLIPKGKPVRCATFQAVTTPLYLYRGLTETSTNAHFLGRFEVAGSPTNSGVEVWYIIDHQQILLCARDSDHKQFVELRRVDNEAAK